MSEARYDFEVFSTREGFNKSLTHFQAVSSLLGDFEGKTNLADILNELIADKEIVQDQIGPTVYALLVDKYGYAFESFNMTENFSDFAAVSDECVKWKAVDVVITYHHPELGLSVINPKSLEQLQAVQSFKRNELVTVYAGGFAARIDTKISEAALKILRSLLSGKSVKTPQLLLKGSFPAARARKQAVPAPRKRPAAPKAAKKQAVTAAAGTSRAAAPAAAPVQEPAPSASKRMTPLYSIPVTNELFHNGNVEAWKKIIQSYQHKYPGLDVYIFYEGERIHDINTLFKWGKVKHGSTILFSVAGDTILDVAKLQRYLRQGASPRFEDFLRFPVNTVLKLF